MIGFPICINCKYFKGVDREIPAHCDAFPDIIPFKILSGRADHRKPYPGDNGIRFAPKKDDSNEHE